MSSTFNYERFKLVVINAEDFFDGKYIKIDVKFRDPDGFFGAKNYDYFVYGNKKTIDETGSSKIHLMIHNRKSFYHMRQEVKDLIRKRMKDFEIDIDDVEKNDKVIVAIDDSGSLIGRGSASIYFTPYRGERKDVENGKV